MLTLTHRVIHMNTIRKSLFLLALLCSPFCTTAVNAQNLQIDDLFDQASGLPGEGEPEFEYRLQANSLEKGAPVVFTISVVLPVDRYTYSMQDENSATQVRFEDAAGLEPVSEFTADRNPKISINKELGWTSEKYYGSATWVRHYRITDPDDAKLGGKITGSFCTETADGGGNCLPFEDDFAVNIAVTKDDLPAPPQASAGKVDIRPYATEITPTRKLGGDDVEDPIRFRIALTPEDAAAGEEVTLSIEMEIFDGWHTFSQDMDDIGGQPTTIDVKASGMNAVDDGFKPDHEPHTIEVDLGGGLTSTQPQFEKKVTWTRRYKVADGVSSGAYGVYGSIEYQICKQSCKPLLPVAFGLGASTAVAQAVMVDSPGNSADVESKPHESSVGSGITNSVVADTPEEIAAMTALYQVDNPIAFEKLGTASKVKTTLLTAMFGAFVGGIILNLMPCVFPVLGIKVMGFVQLAGDDPKKIRLHGIAFSAGLVFSMWCLAGFILFLKFSLKQSVNWGQQMGNPYFVGGIIILLFVLGLNMAGIFEMGTTMTRVGGGLHKKKGYSQSFFSGILTTLIATPCSGPFLGAAMGYTLAQSAPIAIFLFTIFALGIALPYLVLSFFPALINKLPRPGAWMETFKVTMAFALFATAAFFLKTFGGQTGIDGMAWLTMGLVVIALAFYFYGRWSLPHLKLNTRLIKGFALPVAVAAAGLWMAYESAQFKAPPAQMAGWQTWRPGKIEYLTTKKKRVVFVDYTADW